MTPIELLKVLYQRGGLGLDIRDAIKRCLTDYDITVRLAHPDRAAVDKFAQAMKLKLAKDRVKGRSSLENYSLDGLSTILLERVEKGDPMDVAIICMMLWSIGATISQPDEDDDSSAEIACLNNSDLPSLSDQFEPNHRCWKGSIEDSGGTS